MVGTLEFARRGTKDRETKRGGEFYFESHPKDRGKLTEGERSRGYPDGLCDAREARMARRCANDGGGGDA